MLVGDGDIDNQPRRFRRLLRDPAQSPAHLVGLAGFGTHLGLACQLADDVLGTWGDPEALGKPVLPSAEASTTIAWRSRTTEPVPRRTTC